MIGMARTRRATLALSLSVITAFLLGCGPGVRAPIFTPVPTATPTETPTPSPVPTVTPSPLPSAEVELESTPGGLPSGVGEGQPPPFDIELPLDWDARYYTVRMTDTAGALFTLNVAVYSGPTGVGDGWIWVLWGFPPLSPEVGLDAIYLLRFALFEESCDVTVVTANRPIQIGNETGVGTDFLAEDCQNEPPAAGWMVALTRDDINYAFYPMASPLESSEDAYPVLREILDTVTFH